MTALRFPPGIPSPSWIGLPDRSRLPTPAAAGADSVVELLKETARAKW